MKAVILAGGLGTRLSEETNVIPKPMVKIGNYPIIWHIMKYYSEYGINDFIICLGYKGHIIKEFFISYSSYMSDLKINTRSGNTESLNNKSENWNIELIETGLNTMTGGRLRRVKKYIGNNDFLMTYGDGLSDININKLISFHNKSGRLATITSVSAPSRFGSLTIEKNLVTSFEEKPKKQASRINGGFFVLSPKVLEYIKDDDTIWEGIPLKNLSKEKQLIAYDHEGFWQPMDTIREKNILENLWISNKAPWKIW